ncbi:trypsin-like serine protease [Pedomonas mirosovicensis]|uniref:trypsin-like serine protease n=1 Tax=Pedomonas mirosovicensis TaxID=2908641 RepID=UPI0021696261|nr:trypsin-like serine protease [Pedomonas mirosovicensis]MCH8684150.1 trypsin-like serine protease [Pedomonas mirosovicensis]
MKKFLSSLCVGVSVGVVALAGSTVFMSSEANAVPLSAAQARPLLKTTGNYLDPRYFPSSEQRNGTALLMTPINNSPSSYVCSGTVVSPTQIVTAAHCVDTHDPRSPEYGTTGTTQVYLGGRGSSPIASASYEIHPLYFDPIVGSPGQGAFATGDIAIITLSEPVPAGTKIYGLYGGDAIGKVSTHISYGTTGNGDGTGENLGLDSLTNGRIGQNLYESDLASLFGVGLDGAHLLYDFDDGTPEHNAMAWWASPFASLNPDGSIEIVIPEDLFPDLGLGLDEVLIDGGDSGGGSFIDDLLAGVHSFGVTLAGEYCDGILNPNPDDPYDTTGDWNPEISNPSDVTCANDSTFGEIAGDTSIAFFYDWLMQRLDLATEVPAPATLGLFGFGLAALGLGRRRRA